MIFQNIFLPPLFLCQKFRLQDYVYSYMQQYLEWNLNAW